MSLAASTHEAVAQRLQDLDQRYTPARRQVVEALAAAGRPLTMPELLAAAPALKQSSAYRSVTVLAEAGVVDKVAGADEHSRMELAEELAGHHHHLICQCCGAVVDVAASARLEKALAEASAAAAELGYDVTGHRIDLVGRCAPCAGSGPEASTGGR